MIKTALKHWIYELCIEQIFLSIERNFAKVPNPEILELLRMHVGERLNAIYYLNDKGRTIVYYEPMIEKIINMGSGIKVQIEYSEIFDVRETDSNGPKIRIAFLYVERIKDIL